MESKGDSEENEEYTWKLDTIPPEIFLHICSFLSAKFVINVLKTVCKKFSELIEDDTTWRMRICTLWPKRYPLVPDPDLDWKEACIEREEHYWLWKNSGQNMNMYHLKDAHFGSVNVVNVIEDGHLCASGGRDGALKLWNITLLKDVTEPDLFSSSCLTNTRAAAHDSAWLWSIAYNKNNRKLYSGGFDSKIKSWDINSPADPVNIISLASPILCLNIFDQSLVSGCYGRSVSLFDQRDSQQPVLQHIQHKKPVICIVCDEKFIISGSEDKTVVVYDKTARKVWKTIKLGGLPLCMSYDYHQLLVGDVHGFLHVIDPTNESFELIQSYETGHKLKVTGIQHSLGSIITCSTDKTIRILEPNCDPGTISVLNCSSEVSKISTYKTTLASANTDDSITIWLPNEDCS